MGYQQRFDDDRDRDVLLERKALEREADIAATRVLRGLPASIALRAPVTAYAFDDSEDHGDVEQDHATPELDRDAFDPKAELAAASTPVAADDVGGGGVAVPGGGGGAEATPRQDAPNVAGARPEDGLGQLRGVRPDQLPTALGQVHSAAATDVDKARAQQKAKPPTLLSTGGPVAKVGGTLPAAEDAPRPAKDPKVAQADAEKPVRAEAPGATEEKKAVQSAAKQQQQTAGAVIDTAAQSNTRWFSSWFGGKAGEGEPTMADDEAAQLARSLDSTPAAADISTDTGPAPNLEMTGEVRSTADKDRATLEARTAQLEAQGATDSRVPMGEDEIETTVATEELVAKALPGAAANTPAFATVAGAASSEEIGIIAREEHGAEIDAAMATAQADVAVERGKHEQEDAKARADADNEVLLLKTKADADQEQARSAARADVEKARGEWRAEIDKKGTDARKQADGKIKEGMSDVETKQTAANDEAKKHIDEGKQQAETEKQKGAKEAQEAKQKGTEKSSGFLGWVSSKAKAFFDGIKQAISKAIEAARAAVKKAIDAAKKLAMAAIDLARTLITAAIKAIGQVLLAITDMLLAAFPELKAKFQKAIRGFVDKAVKAVDRLAANLKDGVQKALDGLGAVLDKALALLEKGLHFIVDVANAVVEGALEAAEAIASALGTWVTLIKDIASRPGSWIANLGAAVIDGIKHHLWAALKTAVVEWFKSKVMELLGIGGVVLEILIAGGMTSDDITSMALDALIVAIPLVLVTILIEKLVSMIVPAAGAVMAIIEGLQAAWGTVSRIIAAFAAFMAFLLAVKTGSAGPLFATALAAAAVVLLDFVANWLLRKLQGPARKVGARLKGIADKFKKRGPKGGKPKGADARAPVKDRRDDDDASPSKKDGHDDKKKGKDRDKDKDENDMAGARRAANAAADRGWHQARSASSRHVVSPGEMQSILARAANSSAKVRVDVDVEDKGDAWSIQADARVGKAHARDSAGHGWIARGETGQKVYVAENLKAFNRGLIDETFAELGKEKDGEKAKNLHAAFDEKIHLAKNVERRQQAKLDGRVKGIKLAIAMEPFSGVENDKKVRTKVTVTPNHQGDERQLPLEAEEFIQRFKVSQPTAGTTVDRIGATKVKLDPPDLPPMLSEREKLPAYAINVVTTPGGVTGDLASRYVRKTRGAWKGSGAEDLARARTAVIAGINTLISIDPERAKQAEEKIRAAIARVYYYPGSLLAAFGFTWKPSWKDGESPTALTEVRKEWLALPDADREHALAATEGRVKQDEGIPYGVFRNEVLNSEYTHQAVDLLKSHCDPVYVLSQDADGGVQGAKLGVLAEYDDFLESLGRHPMMVIGGYRFRGFDWGTKATPRSAQLTMLANEIDRAIREAIGKHFPQMLYPTEPNVLIKARSEQEDGVFDRMELEHEPLKKDLFGVGGGEGREAKKAIIEGMNLDEQTNAVAFARAAGVVSSPAPEEPDRGLTIQEEDVRAARTGELYARVSGTTRESSVAPHRHAMVALELQRQSMLNPKNLANEIRHITPGIEVDRLRKSVFNQITAVGRDLADDPALAADSERIQQRRDTADAQIENMKARRQHHADVLKRINLAVREIIDALTSKDLREVWKKLQKELKEIEDGPSEETPT